MRKTGKNAENRAPEAKHQGATQPGRPEKWHGLAVPHGTASSCHVARPCHACWVGIFGFLSPFLLPFQRRLRVGFLPRLFPHQIQGSLRANLGQNQIRIRVVSICICDSSTSNSSSSIYAKFSFLSSFSCSCFFGLLLLIMIMFSLNIQFLC